MTATFWAQVLQGVGVKLLVALVVAIVVAVVRPLRRRVFAAAKWALSLIASARLARRLRDAGVSNFYVGRGDWARYRKPPLLPDYLRTAKSSVQIGCYWMAQGSLEGVPRACAALAEAGVEVSIVMVAPDSELPAVLARDLGRSAEAIRSDIRNSIDDVSKVRAELSQGARERYKVGVSSALLQAAVILLDAETDSGRIQLEFRQFGGPRSDGFSVELSAGTNRRLYQMMKASLELFFKGADFSYTGKRKRPQAT